MVKFRILDDKGDTVLELQPEETMEKMRQEAERGRWLYLNGEVVNIDHVTMEDINKANEIVSTPMLKGGSL